MVVWSALARGGCSDRGEGGLVNVLAFDFTEFREGSGDVVCGGVWLASVCCGVLRALVLLLSCLFTDFLGGG